MAGPRTSGPHCHRRPLRCDAAIAPSAAPVPPTTRPRRAGLHGRDPPPAVTIEMTAVTRRRRLRLAVASPLAFPRRAP